MKIHELATKTDLTISSIRFYEKQGLLGTPYVHREANNYRDYGQDAVELLLMLRKFQTAGFTLAEFKRLVEAYNANDLSTHQTIELLYQKKLEIHQKQEDLQHMQDYINRMIAHKLALITTEEKKEA